MQLSRKKKFKIALAVAEMSAEEFARNLNCSREMIHRVLANEKASYRIKVAIDSFIRNELLKLGIID